MDLTDAERKLLVELLDPSIVAWTRRSDGTMASPEWVRQAKKKLTALRRLRRKIVRIKERT